MLESTNRERVGSRAVASAFSKVRRMGVSKREDGRTVIPRLLSFPLCDVYV